MTNSPAEIWCSYDRLWAINHHISCELASGRFYCTAHRCPSLAWRWWHAQWNSKGLDCIVTVMTDTGLRVCILNSFPCRFSKAMVVKGLKSLGITSSCYPRVQRRETFHSTLLSEKGLCRGARLQCWLTGKPVKSECVVRASHMSCSKHERKGGRYLSGDATGEVQHLNTSQQKLPWISTYQCEEQILLFLFSCCIDVLVTLLCLQRILQHREFLLLPTLYPSFIAICHHTWNN